MPSMRTEVELIRLTEFEGATFGCLIIAGEPFCLTLEKPWLANMRERSCIPTGRYLCREHVSPRFGKTYLIHGVQDRSQILFHAGNLAEETRGCVLLGSYFGRLRGQPAVLNSRTAFNRFLVHLEGQPVFDLSISYAS